jgi:hypothetical protein
MPFGLRNASTTYQRCMNHVFGNHIDTTVEACVDDIVVKKRKAFDLVSNLEQPLVASRTRVLDSTSRSVSSESSKACF